MMGRRGGEGVEDDEDDEDDVKETRGKRRARGIRKSNIGHRLPPSLNGRRPDTRPPVVPSDDLS